ncbi:hypothetical protein TNCV_4679891 [Trichonephila clavipes]|nr:hypothetical protein TNCV_4679891 [Trichonephila clavipes]
MGTVKCHGKNLTSTTRAPERHDANVLKEPISWQKKIESRNLAQRISTAEGHAQESQEQCNERLQENIIRTRAAGERDIATVGAQEQ